MVKKNIKKIFIVKAFETRTGDYPNTCQQCPAGAEKKPNAPAKKC